MTWASADESERFNTTHIHKCGGTELIGPARWYFKLNGYEKHHEMSNIWPPIGSPARERYTEFVIGHAALLGAEFISISEEDPGWPGGRYGIANHRAALGWHVDRAEAAAAYLSFKGWWVCFNKQDDQWELVKP